MFKIVSYVLFVALALFSAPGQAQYSVVSPFNPYGLLSGQQGGTQIDATQYGANKALVTTGIPNAPWQLVNTATFGGCVTTGGSILYGNGSGGCSNVSVGAGLSFSGGSLSNSVSTSGSALQAGNGSGGLTAASSATIGAPIISVTTTPLTPGSATPVSTGLSVAVTTGGTYEFEIFYYIGSASAGSTLGINGGNITVSSIAGEIYRFIHTTVGIFDLGAISSLSSSFTGNASSMTAHGTFVASSSGNFIPTYATSAAASDTLLAGSWMRLTRIN